MANESTLIQGLLTLIIISAIVYMAVTGQEINRELLSFGTLIVGFWFGSKAQQQFAKGSKNGKESCNNPKHPQD